MSKTIAMFVGPEYEDLELWYPKLRLEEAGHAVRIAGLGESHYRGKHGYPCAADCNIEDLSADELGGLVCPGGWAPDKIRRSRRALDLVRALDEQGKLLATICHGGWVFASAGVLKGRKITSVEAIRDDLQNAGAEWLDAEVVVNRNLVSSRRPPDLPAFGRALVKALETTAP